MKKKNLIHFFAYTSILITTIFYSEHSYCGDTVYSKIVAPGVIHTKFAKPGPYTLDVLEVEIKNPFITLESYRPNGLTKTTIQSQQNDREGHRVIGAINGDFFSFETGWPVGNQVVNGKFVQGLNSSRSQLLIDQNKKPYIEIANFKGEIKAKNGQTFNISGTNTSRGAGSIVFFTSYKGSTTGTDASGTECIIKFISSPLYSNDTMFAIVTSKNISNSSIPSDGGVLSAGSGISLAFINNNINIGDTIQLFLGFNKNISKIVQSIAGGGRIMMNGRYVGDSMQRVEGIGQDFITARHPRTFFGFNKDTSKVYLCTVDGRQSTSIGMSFREMYDFLITIGVWDAFNFDGGGSTTMVVRGEVMNSPSDPAGERSAANSLQVISTAPIGTLSYIRIEPRRIELFQGDSYKFSLSGTDEFFNPITIPSDIIWEADSKIGSIDQTGSFTSLKTNDSGWVKARWNNVKDSVFVVVRMIKSLYIYPKKLIMAPGERLTLLAQGIDSENRKFNLKNSQLNYSYTSQNVNVDAIGQVTAVAFGSGEISVSLDTIKCIIPFNTNGNDTTIMGDAFNDLSNWEIVIENSSANEVIYSIVNDNRSEKPPLLKLNFSYSPKPVLISLNGNFNLSGRCDSIDLRVFGSGNGDTISIYISDKDGDIFVIKSPILIDWKDEWRTVPFKINTAVVLKGGALDFPVSISQIRINPGSKNIVNGKIESELLIDNLQIHYPNRIVVPSVLFNFESGISGWYTPAGTNAAQIKGVDVNKSSLVQSSERAWDGSYSGKWTYVDDAGSSTDWDIRITRGANSDLGNMLRGSYIGAWVYADGQLNINLQIAVRDGNGLICAGPRFPVNHFGWKLIGTKLDGALFSPYLTSGQITDYGNKFNGFRLSGLNSILNGKTIVFYIDKLVTSALTVPTGFTSFAINWSNPIARLHWSVNSEISINRYVIERGINGIYNQIGTLQGQGNVDTAVQYEFVDTPPNGPIYQYRIIQITNDGGQETSKVIEINTGTTSVGPEGTTIKTFKLNQNYPNPFNPSTIINFQLPVTCLVSLKIYDILGREAVTLLNEIRHSGIYNIEFGSKQFPSGIYLYRLEAQPLDKSSRSFIQTNKMMLIK